MNFEAILENALAHVESAFAWFQALVLTPSVLIQLAAILLALLISRFLDRPLQRMMKRILANPRIQGSLRQIAQVLTTRLWLFVWILLLVLERELTEETLVGSHLISAAISLVTAWLIIRLAFKLIKDPLWARTVSVVVWTLAALSILGLIDSVRSGFHQIGFQLGESRFSLLTVVEGILALVAFLWLASMIGQFLERRISATNTMTPSLQVLMSKVVRAGLVVIAIVVALNVAGVDLTAFAIFTGALGVGLGFGLQKVVSNLISGIILLLDNSIKPGDVIALDETYGTINALHARYASVITRDGTEYLIPNEDLITQRVENWTHSSTDVRLKLPIGISYTSDVRRAMELCLEAADVVERVSKHPTPRCLLIAFGDSSVNLELRIWIADPSNGVRNVRSEVLLEVWDRFHEHGIEFPFPQHDIHVKSMPEPVSSVLASKSERES